MFCYKLSTAVIASCHLYFSYNLSWKPGLEGHVYDTNSWKMEVRGSEVQDQLWLSVELEINMGLFTGNVYVKGSFLALLPNNFQIFRMSPDHFCRAGVIDTIFLGSEINLRIFNLSTVLMTHLLKKRDIFTIVFSLRQDFDWQTLWYWTEQKKKETSCWVSFCLGFCLH